MFKEIQSTTDGKKMIVSKKYLLEQEGGGGGGGEEEGRRETPGTRLHCFTATTYNIYYSKQPQV